MTSPTWSISRRLHSTLLAATLLILAAGLSGCGSASHDEALAASRTPASASQSPTSKTGPRGHASPAVSPSQPSGTATRPSNPLAAKPAPVMRNGRRPHPTIGARPEPFTKAVAYGDGLSLRVVRIKHLIQQGYGPGVFHGSPFTQVTIKLTNGTRKAINLDNVVVQVVYGSPERVAPPVYGDGAADFAGLLKAGASQTATYSFSIPVRDISTVSMTVDMDTAHAAAKFTGSLKK